MVTKDMKPVNGLEKEFESRPCSAVHPPTTAGSAPPVSATTADADPEPAGKPLPDAWPSEKM